MIIFSSKTATQWGAHATCRAEAREGGSRVPNSASSPNTFARQESFEKIPGPTHA